MFLFFSVPAVGAKLALINSDRFDYSVERLKFKRIEVERFGNRLTQFLSSFGRSIAVFLNIVKAFLTLKFKNGTSCNKFKLRACT